MCVFEGGSVSVGRSCALLKLKPALHMDLLLYDLLSFYECCNHIRETEEA